MVEIFPTTFPEFSLKKDDLWGRHLVAPNCQIKFEFLGRPGPRLLAIIPDMCNNCMCKVVAHSKDECYSYKEEAKIWRPIVASIIRCAFIDEATRVKDELIHGDKVVTKELLVEERRIGELIDDLTVAEDKWRIWGLASPIIEDEK